MADATAVSAATEHTVRDSDNASRNEPPVLVRDVHKTYRAGPRTVHALRGLNLEINDHGFFAVMGPSGSGKSTLLHLMAALDRPDRGSIAIAGQQLETMTESELTLFRRHHIGIVFQQYNLISTLSALENVTLPAMLDRMPRDERRRRGLALLDDLGMKERADHRPDALSGGEQQRVAIARALLFQPPVLFADEPTGNLDSETSSQVWKLLAEIASHRDMTVLMVTHEPEAASHCERVYVLRDGMVTTSFDTHGIDPSELATRAQHPRGQAR